MCQPGLREYLGLHLTIGLLACVGLLLVFGAIAHFAVGGNQPAFALDRCVGLALRDVREESPALRDAAIVATELGAVQWMACFSLAVALVLLWKRQRQLAAVWLICVVGGALLNSQVKDIFHQPRPWFADPWVREASTPSFPSGHSAGAMVGYGLLAYLLLRALKRPWARAAAVAGLALLILAVGFSRIFLGAHWLSDVLGGLTIGACWLAACVSALETIRRRPKKALPPRP